MIDFLSGALTVSYVIAAGFFVRFWRRTGDMLFLAFAGAFALFALNQLIVFALDLGERHSYAYILRVLGFLAIIAAIAQKNLIDPKQRKF